jgi:hypothetical protein
MEIVVNEFKGEAVKYIKKGKMPTIQIFKALKLSTSLQKKISHSTLISQLQICWICSHANLSTAFSILGEIARLLKSLQSVYWVGHLLTPWLV